VKKYLFKYRKTVVMLLKIMLYFTEMAILFGVFSIHNPQIIVPSRTAAVTI